MVRKLNTTTSCHERSPKPFDFTPWSFLGYILVTKKCKKQMEKSLVEHFWRPSNLRWKARQRTRSTYFARVNQKLTTNFFLKSTKYKKAVKIFEWKLNVLYLIFSFRYVWKRFGKRMSMQHDAYLCQQWPGSIGWPTQRLMEPNNYVASIANDNATLVHKCPRKCRRRLEWEYCWRNIVNEINYSKG